MKHIFLIISILCVAGLAPIASSDRIVDGKVV